MEFKSDTYKDLRVENTYAWIRATALSKIIITLAPAKQILMAGNLLREGMHTKEISKCPATIFAAKRTDKVIGRIITLTSSIITIRQISPSGVPYGTKWTRNSYSDNTNDPKISDNHKTIANLKVNLKCLDDVNT